MKKIKFPHKGSVEDALKELREMINKDLVTRDPKRIPKILDALEIYWEKQPDTRLGQLLMNAAKLNSNGVYEDCFYYEDESLLEFLEDENYKKFLEENGNKGL